MKKLLLVVGVVGSSIFVSGQAPPNAPRVVARQVEKRGAGLWHFSGAVRIETPSIVITADEADGNTISLTTPWEFDLHGNVHVTANPNK